MQGLQYESNYYAGESPTFDPGAPEFRLMERPATEEETLNRARISVSPVDFDLYLFH